MWKFSDDHGFTWGDRTYLMGVLNVTPDSFSDGGQFDTLERAIAQAHQMATDGADFLDIGGESTRPKAQPVSLETESQRVIPVIQAIRQGTDKHPALTTPISVDTTKSAVARAAIAAGANVINDVSGATYDPEMLSTAAELNVPIVLMHLRGTPQTMTQLTQYDDLMGEIYEFLARRIDAAITAGIPQSHIAIDPGIGFAKTYTQSLEILRSLPRLKSLGCPLLVGVSRKSFIGHLLNQPDPGQRVWGTAAACCGAIAGGADLLRVHDVREMHDVCRVADALYR
jgi:dihydropteroate synthase